LHNDEAQSDLDRRFVERQIRAHVDLAQWKPDPHVSDATPDCWRRAFEIGHLRAGGLHETAEIARRVGASEREIEEDSRLLPYLDRTVAGLLAMLGWYVDSQI
jgi:hypothetical protein